MDANRLFPLVLAIACGRSEPAPPSDQLESFQRLDSIPTFVIDLSTDARRSLDKAPREWVDARFRHGVDVFDVRIRLKGHRSMRALDDKPALKIRFDRPHKKQRFLGLKRLTLNNMVEDPTMLREVLGYRIYREVGVPAPFAFYARLAIDGLDYGLYAVIETVDKTFLKRRFKDPSGGLYEGEYGCDLYPDDVQGFDRDSGDEDNGRGDLARFAAAAGGDPAPLLSDQGPIAMERFLGYLAVSAFIGDFDGYRHAHNYRIYHEPTLDKWYFIPWGIDRSFKQQLSIFESYGRLARLCFADAGCRLRYVRAQRTVVEAYEKLDLVSGAEALAAVIEPVLVDSTRHPGGSKINRAREKLAQFLRERPDSIARELSCIDRSGAEIDADGDGYGCLDCDDRDPAVHPGAKELCNGRDDDCSGAVDDDPSCPTCREIAAPGRRLVACDLPRSFVEARSYCQALGGDLVAVVDEQENRVVYAATKKLARGRWWIGLDDRREEGVFVTGANTPPAFTRWAKGEPDNSKINQDCAVLDTKRKGTWHDTHCGQPLPFVCEVGQ